MILKVFSIPNDSVILCESESEICEENVRSGKSIEMFFLTLIFLLVMNLMKAPELNYSFVSLFTGAGISWMKSRWPSLNSYFGSQPISAVLICCSPCINPLQRISKKVQKIAREKRAREKKTHDEEIHRHLLD